VWDFAIAQNKTGHPAVFPQNLIEEHIKSWSNDGDLVLDPFMGSGTTALAAKKLNRKYVGIEISEEYFNLINDRINNSINK
jgi:site-specific DNA-methyltransferase (adenine-specific)